MELEEGNKYIRIEGAKENNLKNVSVNIPANSLVCITGVSGSGKTSLIDDCLIAESKRRHQNLSRSTKFLHTPYHPKIEGAILPFVVSVKQGILRPNSRSTVATSSGFLDHFKNAILDYGELRGANKETLQNLNPEIVSLWINKHYEKETCTILVNIGRRILGPLKPFIAPKIEGFPDTLLCVVEAEEKPDFKKLEKPQKFLGTIAKVQRDIYMSFCGELPCKNPKLLEKNLNVAFSLASEKNDIVLIFKKIGLEITLRNKLIDLDNREPLFKLSESLLSFNSKVEGNGRCNNCDGNGYISSIIYENLFNDKNSFIEGGINLPYDEKKNNYKYFSGLTEEITGLFYLKNIPYSSRWSELDFDTQKEILHGTEKIIQPRLKNGTPRGKKKPFIGLISRLEEKFENKSNISTILENLKQTIICNECKGTRYNLSARSVYFSDIPFVDILKMNFSQIHNWLDKKKKTFKVQNIINSFNSLSTFAKVCSDLGLAHLTLDRSINSLSGGESQRLRIAKSIGLNLLGVCYILDEPTRGLHAYDASIIAGKLKNLVNNKTGVILVEHNTNVIRESDYVIELGNSGGKNGGKVIFEGRSKNSPILKIIDSKTENDFRKRDQIGKITIKGINLRNIIDQDLEIPLGVVTSITGVSGSGKTTIIRDILVPALLKYQENNIFHQNFKSISIQGKFDEIIYVKQNILSSNPRSLIITYLNLADAFRNWFYKSSNAETFKLTKSNFSTNSEDGQCPCCTGIGKIYFEDSDSDFSICSVCSGTRFHPKSLFAVYDSKNIGDWMAQDFESIANDLNVPEIIKFTAKLCCDLGLGYLNFGRDLPSLSGGENQRLRIIKALLEKKMDSDKKNKHIIFVMDEPSSGLHPFDVLKLNQALHKIVSESENTLIMIEHNLEIIKWSDWIIDIGPFDADKGGKILFSGSTEAFLKTGPDISLTRQALLKNNMLTEDKERILQELETKEINKTPHEMIKNFKSFLAWSTDDIDSEDKISFVTPSYFISKGGTNTHPNHDLLNMFDCALPLFRIFANESNISGFKIYKEVSQIKEDIQSFFTPNKHLIGYFPLTYLASEEDIIWHDIKNIIESELKSGIYGWFDGEVLKNKISTKIDRKTLAKVRLIMNPDSPIEENIEKAIMLGQDWFSVIDTETKEYREFSTRYIETENLKIGSRWQTPQIFDPRIKQNSCRLCHGSAKIEMIDESLILSNKNSNIIEEDFFTALAMEVIRPIKKSLLLPAISRLKDAEIIDLSKNYNKMTEYERNTLWFGYPNKKFLKKDGNPEHISDWYKWIGIVNYILNRGNFWKASDRKWANDIKNSIHLVKCPDCDGTGLGWEASSRVIGDISLLDILKTWTFQQLYQWLKILNNSNSSNEIKLLLEKIEFIKKFDLENIKCGAYFEEIKDDDKVKCFFVFSYYNQLLDANAFLESSDEKLQKFIYSLGKSKNMKWLLT